MGKLTRTGVLVLACAALVGGCGGDDDAASDPTPPEIRNAVFDRAFSECGSESIEELAGKHNVDPNSADVSTAVGEFWAGEFGGREDAVREGKLGCLQSMAMETLPGQDKPRKSKRKTTTVEVPPAPTVTIQQP